MKETLRLFVAVEIPSGVKEEVGRFGAYLRGRIDGFRWVSPDRFHLTLRFLGEVDRGRIPMLREELARAAGKVEPFDFHLEGAGAFPSADRPRVIWVGVGQGKEQLIRLAGEIEETVRRAGFAPENRPFTPHLTLARARERSGGASIQNALQPEGDRYFGQVSCGQVVLMSSLLGRGGPTYTALDSLHLGQIVPPRDQV